MTGSPAPITGFGYTPTIFQPKPVPVPTLQTGYWGHVDADNRVRATKVHLRRFGDDRPLCGAAVSEKSDFQYCANGKHTGYLTCETCKTLP